MRVTADLAPVLEAMQAEHREEVAKLQMRLVLYQQTLEEHGIEPPDADGAELVQMWRDSAAVITTASMFVERLGSAKELLSAKGWFAEKLP